MSQLYYLLHDGVVNSAAWDVVWPAFCQRFHTIRYDRRGYGRSPATKKPYYQADDLAALLHDRKISHEAIETAEPVYFLHLFVAQGDEGVDGCCATSGEEAGGEADEQDEGDYGAVGPWIGEGHTPDLAGEETG
jgi:hypothetical protein